jgi:two-component system, chemotaxis family, chemotaxis protein CheY
MDNKVPHVAIVDDENDAVSLLQKSFSMSKIPISFVAYNGLEAIDRFKDAKMKPDVIIMDHRMPLANGIEATREILALDTTVKIIFLSADPTIEEDALHAGAVGFLKKPVSMRTIVAAVRGAI